MAERDRHPAQERVKKSLLIKLPESRKLAAFPWAFSPRTLIRGESRDPCFRRSMLFKQLQCLLRAGGPLQFGLWVPACAGVTSEGDPIRLGSSG
jgi:hypothetical protein